jgi:2-oxoglutarate ferredoxin oxidoreductase subunit alpha
VAQIHIRYIVPLPSNLGDLLNGFDRVLVPEMNNGQLLTLLRSTYAIRAEGLNKVSGRPFRVSEILDAIRTRMGDAS